MKLSQRQQGEGSEAKWGVGAAGRQARETQEHESQVIQAPSREDDDPYRGMSDGEILSRIDF